jgi:hypothetical protein
MSALAFILAPHPGPAGARAVALRKNASDLSVSRPDER